MTHARYLPLLFACVVLVTCTGCPTPLDIASRSFSELKGAQDLEKVISEMPSIEFASYGGIQLDQVVSRIGPLVPAEFIPMVEGNLRKELTSLKGLRGSGPPIRLHGEITYYQPAGSVELLRGKQSVAVMHVTATAADGRVLGEFLVVATSEALRTGDMELAQALARGTARFFQDRLPK